ncbi:MAG: hypothetical protein WB952_19710 [Terriglobales bacterium]
MKLSRFLIACVLLFGLSQSLCAQTTYKGKIVVHFTITLSSPVGTDSAIACNVNANVFDAINSINERAAAIATVSGSTAKCTVTIPYSWTLSTAGTDKISLGYVIDAIQSFEIPGSSGPSVQVAPVRESSQAIGSISVPATGTTTDETVKTTI